jgi:hypothetical protein
VDQESYTYHSPSPAISSATKSTTTVTHISSLTMSEPSMHATPQQDKEIFQQPLPIQEIQPEQTFSNWIS